MLVVAAGCWWWWSAADEGPALAFAPGKVEAREARDAAAPAPLRVAAETNGTLPVGAVVPPQAGVPCPRSSVIEVEVVDDASRPVEGAFVEFFAARCERRVPTPDDAREIVWLGAGRDTVLASLVSDAEGRCACRLEREFAYASARHPRFGQSTARSVSHPPAGEQNRLRLSLLRPVVVRGTVVDADYAVVPHAIVACHGAQAVGKFAPKEQFAANAAGRFEFEAAAGTPCMIAAQRGSEMSMYCNVIAREGTDVIVAFPGAFSVRGRVRDVAGRAVAGAVVDASLELPQQRPFPVVVSTSVPGVQHTTRSNNLGEFELLVGRSETWHVVAGLKAGAPLTAAASSKRVAVTVAPSSRHPFVELVVGEHQPLRGMVTRHDGTPAAGVPLNIHVEAGIPGREYVTTLDDGSFSVLLPPHLRTVWISGPDLAPVAAAPDAQGLRLVQCAPQPPLTLSGEVFDSGGGPITEFNLWWMHTGGQLITAAPGAIRRNTFRLDSPAPGPGWRLLVQSTFERMPFEVEPFDPTGKAHLTIRMPRLASIPVRVLAAGLPARGLNVVIVSSRGAEIESNRTDAQGVADVRPLPPGPVKVLVRRGHEQLAERNLDLLPGPNTAITIEVTL
ncbi:MAG TPA: hypothetical protein VF384_04155 [Planctomycetota bacterium]